MLVFTFNLIFTLNFPFLKFVCCIVTVLLLFTYSGGTVISYLHLPPPPLGSLFPDCCYLPFHLQVRWPNLYSFAHSAHSTWKIPHLMMSFRHLLSTFLNKTYHWSHWKIHCLPAWVLFSLACFLSFPHLPSLSWSLALQMDGGFSGTHFHFVLCLVYPLLRAPRCYNGTKITFVFGDEIADLFPSSLTDLILKFY